MTFDRNPGSRNTGAPRFSVGIVVGTALKVIQASLFRFLGIILAVAIPALVLIAVVVVVMAGGAPNGEGGMSLTLERGSPAEALFLLTVALIALVAYALIQAALTFGALQTLAGSKPGIGACLKQAFAALPRTLLASLILFVLLVVVGTVMVLLVQTVVPVAPGSMGSVVIGLASSAAVAAILVRVWVYIPVVVIERAGPVACFRRSMALSQGRRWLILAIFALVVVANYAVSLLASTLPRIGAPMAGAALNFAAAIFFMAFGAVLAAVGYYVLRVEKERRTIDEIMRGVA